MTAVKKPIQDDIFGASLDRDVVKEGFCNKEKCYYSVKSDTECRDTMCWHSHRKPPKSIFDDLEPDWRWALAFIGVFWLILLAAAAGLSR